MVKTINYNDYVYYNTGLESYGSAVKIKKHYLKLALLIFCLVTPFTNWLLIFSNKIKDITVRYE